MRRGFSLVEISIVLVILGLLVGGILAGQSLIRAAELRAVTTKFHRFATAINAFRDKYFAIPGDFRDATRVWGTMNSDTDCLNSGAAITANGACDGNANGRLQGTNYEPQQFWRQMALAGLIEGTYSGIPAVPANGWSGAIGTAYPRSRLSSAGWGADSLGNYDGDSAWFASNYGNNLVFGATTAEEYPSSAILKAEEAWNIDTKMDDGRPALGSVLAVRRGTCTNAANATDTAANYQLQDSAIACALSFSRAF